MHGTKKNIFDESDVENNRLTFINNGKMGTYLKKALNAIMMIKGKNSVDAKYIFHDVVFKFIFNVLG